MSIVIHPSCVTRLGDFLKFFVSNFLLKVAQLFGYILGFLKTSLFKLNCYCYFLGNFWEKLDYFFISRLRIEPNDAKQ